ncbi:MAG: hypothetical protein V1839_01215 [archaeon]
MLSQEERSKLKIDFKNPIHILQSFKERGKSLFGNIPMNEMLDEVKRHVLNYQRSVIVPDDRPSTQSTHSAIFVTDYGKLASIPVVIDKDKITILTLKDVIKDEVNPNWHIGQFNEIGSKKGLTALPLHYRANNGKA